MTYTNQLILMWWNTSLSPPVSNPGRTVADREFAVDHIKMLYRSHGFDLLGLCEVASVDLSAIKEGLADYDLELLDTTDRGSQLIIDTAVVYNRNKLICTGYKHYIDRYGHDTLKAGTLISFQSTETQLPIFVVISHWPGRRSAPEHAAKRGKLGNHLYSNLKQLKKDTPNAHIVLMGDYNDEPFAESLSSYLLASRDRELARNDDQFYYNPFWTRMGESVPFPTVTRQQGICGTHYYRGGENTRWFTFDQMIFSSPFLREDGPAILDEEHCQILATPELDTHLRSGKSIFDHFPIRCIIALRA